MGLSSRSSKTQGAAAGTTVIAAGTRFDGELKPASDLQLDGILIGGIESEGNVIIGADGSFEGTLKARHVCVKGHAYGRLQCERLEITSAGIVTGEIQCDALIITPGGRFRGESRDKHAPEAGDGGRNTEFLRPVAL